MRTVLEVADFEGDRATDEQVGAGDGGFAGGHEQGA